VILGVDDGRKVGEIVGIDVGLIDGDELNDGMVVGILDGLKDGCEVGSMDGINDGVVDGFLDIASQFKHATGHSSLTTAPLTVSSHHVFLLIIVLSSLRVIQSHV
jgi:hypothetical protein